MAIHMTTALFVFILLGAKLAMQILLDHRNRQEVNAHRDSIPDSFKEFIDDETYRKSIDYTLAKSHIGRIELIYDTLILAGLIFFGFFPWMYSQYFLSANESVWIAGIFLIVSGLVASVLSFPFEWYHQFRLEDRFGFNNTTLPTWITDKIKGLVLSIVIGLPLIVLLMKTVDWLGDAWWVFAWILLVGFQFIMMILAPILILPLFNKFTPLPEGDLKNRLFSLSERTGFKTKSILVMDGSRRSTHSNAFFTGFGKFRKIVLFDTLIEQLEPEELEAVLAHEIGHYKKGHLLKSVFMSTLTMLGAFYVISLLVKSSWFLESFGFQQGNLTQAILIFSLLGGTFSFWLNPLFNFVSRKHEFEADAFAAKTQKNAKHLIGSLRKLSEKNLSNLTPDNFYSRFYYSHPTLTERESALNSITP